MSKYVQTLNRLQREGGHATDEQAAESGAEEAGLEPGGEGTARAADTSSRRAVAGRGADAELRRAAALDGSDRLFDRLRALAVDGLGAVVIAGAVPTRSVAAIASSLVSQAERRGLVLQRAEVRDSVGRTAVLRPLGRGAGNALRLDLHDDSGEEQIRRWRAESSPPTDLLVIEAPPLSTGADAALLARATDGLVIVAESLVTDRAALVESTQRARATNCRLLGIVLDRTRDRSPRWLGRLVG
ncbi:MAG: hypothetical protein WCH13_07870 [Deltaproteobacteria bacterium]